MSARPSPAEPPGPAWSRRRVLGAAALGVTALAVGIPTLAGCSGADGAPTALATPPPDTVGLILDRHRAIRAAYAQTAAAHPGLDELLTTLRGQIDEHIAALEQAFARPSAGPTPDGTADAGATPGVAPDEATARVAVRQAVEAAIPDLRTLVGRTDAERAPLVGSVAASCACHVEVLS